MILEQLLLLVNELASESRNEIFIVKLTSIVNFVFSEAWWILCMYMYALKKKKMSQLHYKD